MPTGTMSTDAASIPTVAARERVTGRLEPDVPRDVEGPALTRTSAMTKGSTPGRYPAWTPLADL